MKKQQHSTATKMTSVVLAAMMTVFSSVPARAASPANDNACDSVYSSGGDNYNGKNGGSGLNAWQLVPGSNGGNSGSFAGNSGQNGGGGGTGINCGSGKSWGLYANNGAQSTALRPFAGGGLIPGQSVSIDMDNGWINGPYDQNNVHELQILNGSGVMRFGFHYRGGAGDYQIYDASDTWFQRGTGIQFTDGGLHLVFTLLTMDTYSVTITRLDDNSVSTFTGTLGGAVGSSLQSLFFVNRNAGEGGNFDAFFNNIVVSCNGQPGAPSASSDSPRCEGSDLHLSASGIDGGTYSWSGPNGFSSSDQNPTISGATPAASGTYTVTVTKNGCVSGASSTAVTINPSPASPSPSNDGPICPGGTVHLSANTTAGNYTWTGPGGFTSADQNPTVANAAAGTYNLVVNNSGCASPMGSTTVSINAPPTCSIAGPAEACAGSSANFSGPSGAGLSYSWSVSGAASISGAANGQTVSVDVGNGGFTVSLTVTKDGCSSTCNQSVVNDQTAPVISCPADTSVECNSAADPSETGSATATDNCGGAIAITHSDAVSGSACNGSIARTWTATDAAGNSASCVQTISKHDTTAPSLLNIPADVSVQCASEIPAALSGPRAWGLYANSGAISEATRSLNSALAVGQTFAIDMDNGYLDTGSAVGFGLQNSAGQNRFELIFVGGDVFYRVKGSGSDITTAIPYTGEGIHAEVTLTGADTYSVKIIRIQSGDAQTIAGTLGGDAGSAITGLRLFNFRAGGGSAFDAFFNSIAIAGVASDSASASAYEDGWQGGDNGGAGFGAWSLFGSGGSEPETFGRFVGNSTQNDGGDSNTDGDINSLTVTASDNCDAHVPVSYSETDNGASGCSGHPRIITRTWTATDDCGNTASQSQTITQEDTLAPVLSGVPANVGVQCAGDVPAAAAVTASDNCDASASASLSETTDGNVITRTWTSTDACGNSASASQTITINDTIAPVISCPANATVECTASTAPGATGSATASDNCDANPAIAHSDSEVAGACAGAKTITRTWTATDASGNSSSCEQTITVQDTTAPTLVGVPADATAECGSVPAAANVTATDGCDANPGVSLNESASGNQITRTWTATDDCGNSASASQVITIQDTTAPVLSGQGADATIEGPASPSFTAPTASDVCDSAPSISFTDATSPGACAGSYSVTRTWIAVDSSGNSSAPVSQTITVSDTAAPVLSGVPADVTVECDAVPAAANVTASDASDNDVAVSLNETTAAGACPGSYTITRTWTAEDDCGNRATASQTITVQDDVAPVLAGQGAYGTVEFPAQPVFTAPLASDNCDASPTVSFADVRTEGSCTGSYSVTRTWLATDNCGNQSAPVSQTIDVVDTTLPVLVGVPADVSVECDAVPLAATVTANDNSQCHMWVGFVETIATGHCASSYTMKRVWTATDACGNSVSATQTLTVSDTTPPTTTALLQGHNVLVNPSFEMSPGHGTSFVEGWTNYNNGYTESLSARTGTNHLKAFGNFGTNENFSGAYQDYPASAGQVWRGSVYVMQPSNDPWIAGNEAKIRIEFYDAANVMLDAADSIHLKSTTPMDAYVRLAVTKTAPAGTDHVRIVPTYMQLDPTNGTGAGFFDDARLEVMQTSIHVQCLDDVMPADPSLAIQQDNCDPFPVCTYIGESSNGGAGTPASHLVLTRTFRSTDACGNSADASVTIQVYDDTAPVLSGVPANTTAQCGAIPAAATVTATDHCSGNVAVNMTETQTAGDCAGGYAITRTWSATDAAGNIASASQVITVSDTQAPTLSGQGANATVQCPASPSFTAPTAQDNCDAAPSISSTDATVPGACAGSYSVTRTWIATDVCGNQSAPVSQTISVVDTTAPVLSGGGANATIQCPASPSFSAPTASDNCDAAPSISSTDSTSPGACPGSYSVTRTWVATDACGNQSAPKSQTISVVDTTAPALLGVPANATVECSAIPAPANVTASDGCDASVSVSLSEVTSGNHIVRTWTATDDCGNSASASQTLTVQDTTAPVLSGVPANTTMQCGGSPAAANVTASDLCDTSVPVTMTSSTSGSTITRTWTATDDSGNSVSASQVITVVDTIAPTLSGQGANATIQCPAVPSFTAPTATDGCDAHPVITFTDVTTAGSCAGSYSKTRTWKATDASGNQSATVSQTITVVDTTAPVIACAPNQSVAAGTNGAVNFSTPTATDACQGNVAVVCSPASGSVMGPGAHTITATATDACGNQSSCTFTVTVVSSSLRIVIESPLDDDNVANNIETDADVQNVFKSGSTVPHKIHILNSSGQDVTASLAGLVTVKINVTERQYVNATTSTLVNDVPENYNGQGNAGGVMVYSGSKFQYNLDTSGYPAGTVNSPLFFRSLITVEYNSAPGTIVAQEDALLESK